MCPLLTNTFFLEQFGVIIGELLQQCCILCSCRQVLKFSAYTLERITLCDAGTNSAMFRFQTLQQ